MRELLEQELLQRSQGTYLWLSLVMEDLKRMIGKTKKKVLHALDQLLKDIEDAYEIMLNRCEKKDLTRTL